jgi:hypothetical protein
MTDEQRDALILDMLADRERALALGQPALTVSDMAMELADKEVAAGEYGGCSTELEIAFSENEARIERVKEAVTP